MPPAHAGVPVETVKVDTAAQPAELLAVNPLGRIPVLLAEDGLAIHDSRSITHYLDRLSGRRLYPRKQRSGRARRCWN